MIIHQYHWSAERGWEPSEPVAGEGSPQLVLLFGGRGLFEEGSILRELKDRFSGAVFAGCTTAGEIADTQVSDDGLVCTAVHFERSRVEASHVTIQDAEDSFKVGCALARGLEHEGLHHVLLFSDGLHVNGSDLVDGLAESLPQGVYITGGLSGDADRFQKTYVLQDGVPEERVVQAVGLYGDSLRIGYGSLGGWDPFGPERMVTRSRGNVLFELDGKSALKLYKDYLGDHARDLPAAGLLFPLAIRTPGGAEKLVRTILAVDEEEGSLTFAGDVPEGSYARLMKANFNRLIDGAVHAAQVSLDQMGDTEPELALLISCVGRKMVLRQRIEEEVEGVREVLGKQPVMTGFYSYGEISPIQAFGSCELHNQTMTITTLREEST